MVAGASSRAVETTRVEGREALRPCGCSERCDVRLRERSRGVSGGAAELDGAGVGGERRRHVRAANTSGARLNRSSGKAVKGRGGDQWAIRGVPELGSARTACAGGRKVSGVRADRGSA